MSGNPRERLENLTDDEAITWLWRHGRLAATVGASIGLGSCLAFGFGLLALITLLLGPRATQLTSDEVVPLLIRAAGLVVLGAAIGLSITGARFGSRQTAVLGHGAQNKRIRRAVFRNDATPLTPDEQSRATRYAPLGEAAMRFQTVSLGVLYLGILLQQIPQLLQDPSTSGIDLRPIAIITVILLLVVFAALVPIQIRNTTRSLRYTTEHPHIGGTS